MAHFWAPQVEGGGLVRDVSRLGIRILIPDTQPRVGEAIQFLLPIEGEAPLLVRGRVIRRDPDGFAARFCALNPKLQAALVGAGKRVRWLSWANHPKQ